MNTNRTNAVVVGVSFIIATVAGSIAAAIGNPITGAPDYLSKIAANEGTMLIEALLGFLMAITCAGVGLGMLPHHAQIQCGDGDQRNRIPAC